MILIENGISHNHIYYERLPLSLYNCKSLLVFHDRKYVHIDVKNVSQQIILEINVIMIYIYQFIALQNDNGE